jgi:hypothetical protein
VRAEQDGLALELRRNPASHESALVRLRFEGASTDVSLEGLDPRPGVHSFFIGNDPAQWQRGLRGYASVAWRGLYPGIDLILGGREGELKYDLLIAPRADLDDVVLRFEGLQSLCMSGDDVLTAETVVGELLHVDGPSWQILPSGEAQEVECLWRLEGGDTLRFQVPGRDPSLPLVIDPGLLWSTYFGGPGDDQPNGLALDAAGDAYICGATSSGLSFPMTPGTFQAPQVSTYNCFAAKFRGATGELVYSSVFGGSMTWQIAADIAVDSLGRATVVGGTHASDFPTTSGSFDPIKDSPLDSEAGFLTRFTASGDDLEFSAFVEGPLSGGLVTSVRVDGLGRSFIGGGARGPDFPTTPGVFQTQYFGLGDGMVARVSADGSTLDWSTLLGGIGGDGVDRLVLDPSGEVVIAGRTSSTDFPTTPGVFMERKGQAHIPLFVARLNESGTALVWSTFLGGSSWSEDDGVHSLNLGPGGSVYLSGGTNTDTFPTTPGALQGTFQPGAGHATFITRLARDAKSLIFSTFYGGTLTGGVAPIVVDPSGVMTGVGTANSQKLWSTPGALDTTWNEHFDYHLVRFSPQGDRVFYASFLGGPNQDSSRRIALTPDGRVTVIGASWFPGGFPTTADAFQTSYNGGQLDGLVTTLELYLLGVEPFGVSKPSCLGPLTMNVTEMPAPGATRFAFWCSAAPPNAKGWLLLNEASTAPVQSGRLAQLGFSGPFARIPVQSDAAGYVETPFPLTHFTDGDGFAALYVFLDSPSCPSNGRFTWSNGLKITVTTPP